MALPEFITGILDRIDPLVLYLTLLFLAVIVLTLVLTRLSLIWAGRFGILDEPDWRKVHKHPVARAGGLAFFPVFAGGLAVVMYCWPEFWQPRYAGLVGAALIIALTGIVDDIFGMKAPPKLTCQLAAASLLYFSGYQFHAISLPFSASVFTMGIFDFFLTIFMVAAVINAVNMLDGLDGLAAGSSFIMCGFLCFNKVVQGAATDVAVSVIAMGIALAFLRYNFHPARVFMGDTGSMFFGLVLAAEVLDSASRGAAFTTILLPMVILSIPVFDMLRTVVTRARDARNIFSADKSHLHHQLLNLGFSHAGVVVFIYLMNIYMGIMAIIYSHVSPGFRGLYVVNMGLFLFIAFYLVAMRDRKGRDHE